MPQRNLPEYYGRMANTSFTIEARVTNQTNYFTSAWIIQFMQYNNLLAFQDYAFSCLNKEFYAIFCKDIIVFKSLTNYMFR